MIWKFRLARKEEKKFREARTKALNTPSISVSVSIRLDPLKYIVTLWRLGDAWESPPTPLPILKRHNVFQSKRQRYLRLGVG